MVSTSLRLAVIVPLVAFFGSASFAAATGPQTVPELLAVIKNNPDPEIKKSAIERLGDISEADERNNNVSEVLVDVVSKSGDPFVPKTAVKALTRIYLNVSKRAKAKYMKPFMDILKSKDSLPGVRSEIAEAFRQTLENTELQDKDAFKILTDIAANKAEPNIALRQKCIEAVGTFGLVDGLPLLSGLLSETDPLIREAAVKALLALVDKDPTIAGQANLASVNKLMEMLKVKDDKDVTMHVAVIHLLAQMISNGNKAANGAMDEIIKQVKNSEEVPIVLACIEALGIIGTAQAAEPLKLTYADYFKKTDLNKPADVPVRKAIAKAYRSLLSVQAVRAAPDLKTVHLVAQELIKILDEDKVLSVQQSAAYALGYLYPRKFEADQKEAILALIDLMKTTEDPALKALIPDVLEAISKVNFGQDMQRWLDYQQKLMGNPKP